MLAHGGACPGDGAVLWCCCGTAALSHSAVGAAGAVHVMGWADWLRVVLPPLSNPPALHCPAGTHMMIKPWNYFDELPSMVSVLTFC